MLCDGWVAAGAYKPEEAVHHLAALEEQRHIAGRRHEPFDIYLSLMARPDVDLYKRFEEEHGVTDILCAPGRIRPGQRRGFARDSNCAPGSTRRSALPTTIMAKAR